MLASVYRKSGDWWVLLTLNGTEVDCAGPFDDQLDAEQMALRATEVE